MNQRPMPVVGPPMPGPLGDPLDPLPMAPLPREVGLVPGLVPEAPLLLPLAPEVGGHSACEGLPPEGRTQSLLFPACAPAVSPANPPLPDAGGLFDSTELPDPKVLELVPEVEGVAVCADAIPAASISDAINIQFFMFAPAKSLEE